MSETAIIDMGGPTAGIEYGTLRLLTDPISRTKCRRKPASRASPRA